MKTNRVEIVSDLVHKRAEPLGFSNDTIERSINCAKSMLKLGHSAVHATNTALTFGQVIHNEVNQ